MDLKDECCKYNNYKGIEEPGNVYEAITIMAKG
jgi:hypothetical protein